MSDPVEFGEKLANSQAFGQLFREGMDLVEATAAYLDGPGREESRQLERNAAFAYATESMRLTTRLMQLASWLLLQRAVNEGELSIEEARREKTRVRAEPPRVAAPDALAVLPERLGELIAQAMRLQERVEHLDRIIYAAGTREAEPATPAPAQQLNLLRSAFEGR